MKVTITFTLESPDHAIEFEHDPIFNFNTCKDEKTSLHEALCQAIHEGNALALEWLNTYVTDIRTSDLT